jgi:Hint domain
MAAKPRPIDPRRRHFFRVAAAAGAMIPLSLMIAKETNAKVYGDPQRHHPPMPATKCLLSGTRVLTAGGDIAVEHLQVGDLVLTASGAFKPIKGIGSNVFRKDDPNAQWSERISPVRIARSSISAGVPARDLYLSPDHALFIDGHLIPVKNLVNGLSITQEATLLFHEVEYFHLAFEQHEVFYAEGTAVESLLVGGVRGAAELFDQYDGAAIGPMVPYAPLLGYFGGRQEAIAFARLSVYPWIDVRDRIQVEYERLAQRAQMLYEPSTGRRIAA